MKVGDLVRMTMGEMLSWERQEKWGRGIVTQLNIFSSNKDLVEIYWFKWGRRNHIKEAIEVVSESR